MKGDEVIELIKLHSDASLLLYRWHVNLTLQQLVKEEIEPHATLLKHLDLLREQRGLKPMPQETVIASLIRFKYLIKRADNYVSAGRLIADGADVDSGGVIGETARLYNPIARLVCLAHCSAIFELLILRNKASVIRYRVARQIKILRIPST